MLLHGISFAASSDFITMVTTVRPGPGPLDRPRPNSKKKKKKKKKIEIVGRKEDSRGSLLPPETVGGDLSSETVGREIVLPQRSEGGGRLVSELFKKPTILPPPLSSSSSLGFHDRPSPCSPEIRATIASSGQVYRKLRNYLIGKTQKRIKRFRGNDKEEYGRTRHYNFMTMGWERNVAACAKHYVGDGGTYEGINENNTIINPHGLLSIHMPPYYDAIIKGVSTVMVSYSSWNGVKMHANHYLVTDFLKGLLHFRGFVISDWEGINRITSPPGANYSYSIQAGISAGIDMVMIPYAFKEFRDDLTYQVQNNIIPMSRIDDAVRRILRVKFTMGLFENPFADPSLADQLGKKEHRELAREAVRKSLVLLKNGKPGDNPMLPLPKKTQKILIAGSHADNLGYQCGGWTISWQGLGGNNLTTGTTILNAIKSTVDAKTEVIYSENPDSEFISSNKFSYAIVVVGEHPYAETDGDNLNLTIPDPGPKVIQDVCSSIKCVVVLISGRPLVIEPYIDEIDALVAAWLPGTEGQGVADVLFGDAGFSGKLPRTWFRSVDQLPMNVGDPHYDPLFPFGFGLTTETVHAN